MNVDKSFFNKILCFIYKYKKNKLGEKLNIEFDIKEFGHRLKIYHGNIVVNGASKIGDDCELHGNNCIGNKGAKFNIYSCPQIGNNVIIGVGSNIIGDIKIADNIIISANSLVNKSFENEGCVIGGVPAHILKK